VNCAVAIFVKTPGHSPVKTRLWPDLGRSNAERLHLACAAAVGSVVMRACDEGSISGYWATAEATEDVAAAWPVLAHLAQGEGGLGLRMATVYRTLQARHGTAILIGADTPQLDCGLLRRAVEWLQSSSARLVIGPALDGGFWLFGGNRKLPELAWTGVAYGASDTAKAFVASMHGHGDWRVLDTLRDIDTAADIAAVSQQLETLADPTPQQAALAPLLDELAAQAETCP
jgi:rSAM/selenodomain-associated transferase 1